jgi:hypothetical protein
VCAKNKIKPICQKESVDKQEKFPFSLESRRRNERRERDENEESDK